MSAPLREKSDAEIFAAYHRVDRIRLAVRLVIGGALAVVTVALGTLLGTAIPASTSASSAAGIPTPVVSSSPTPNESATPAVVLAAEVLPAPEATPVATTPPVAIDIDGVWRIEIDASGYQSELDACLWVRMDLGASAPIVGAHRSCGGSIVLEMSIGDAVVLTGQGLDGSYLVSDAREAHAGDVAATVTEGMDAVAILQTCYPGSDGRLRLLALRLSGT